MSPSARATTSRCACACSPSAPLSPPTPSPQFTSLCLALALPSLPHDPRFCSNAQRVANRAELQPLLQHVFQQRDAQHWVRLLNDAGVPAQPINNMLSYPPLPPPSSLPKACACREKVFQHEQVKARGMVQQYQHPALGLISCVGHPVKFRCVLFLSGPCYTWCSPACCGCG